MTEETPYNYHVYALPDGGHGFSIGIMPIGLDREETDEWISEHLFEDETWSEADARVAAWRHWNLRGWDRLAGHVTRLVQLDQHVADLTRRLRPPAPLPWRVSQWGNVVDAAGAVVVRFYGPTRRERKQDARQYLTRYMDQRAAMEADRAASDRQIRELLPAEPGKLFGVLDVPDLARVTAAQYAEAFRLTGPDSQVNAVVLPNERVALRLATPTGGTAHLCVSVEGVETDPGRAVVLLDRR